MGTVLKKKFIETKPILLLKSYLKKDESTPKNLHLQILAREIYKVKKDLAPDIMKVYFILLRSLIT